MASSTVTPPRSGHGTRRSRSSPGVNDPVPGRGHRHASWRLGHVGELALAVGLEPEAQELLSASVPSEKLMTGRTRRGSPCRVNRPACPETFYFEESAVAGSGSCSGAAALPPAQVGGNGEVLGVHIAAPIRFMIRDHVARHASTAGVRGAKRGADGRLLASQQ